MTSFPAAALMLQSHVRIDTKELLQDLPALRAHVTYIGVLVDVVVVECYFRGEGCGADGALVLVSRKR
jgi:hypothetical protein